MRLILFLFLLAFTGCAGIKSTETTRYPDGTETTRTITLRTEKYPVGESYILSESNVVKIGLSGSQDASKITTAEGAVSNKRIMYGVCGLICLLGVIAFALPNKIISNKDALIITGVGFAGFAAVRFVEASAPVMAWLLPIGLIVAVAYLVYEWKVKKIKNAPVQYR